MEKERHTSAHNSLNIFLRWLMYQYYVFSYLCIILKVFRYMLYCNDAKHGH
jgi:hypothetical protein